MFERTKSGQQNRARFLGVDFICYVEGDDNNDYAPDITFWQSVLRQQRPDLKVRCVPRGGKPILERLAREIIADDISAVLVAMDSDYDHVTGETIVDRRVLYTYGYSWENDTYSQHNLAVVYGAICHCDPLPTDVTEFIGATYSRLTRDLHWPSVADHVAFRRGSSILPRRSPGRVIKLRQSTDPYVDRAEVLRLVKGAKQGSLNTNNSFRFNDPARFCVGHVYELAMIYLVKAAAKTFGRRTAVSPDHVRDIALSTFSALLQGVNDALFLHHHRQCAAI